MATSLRFSFSFTVRLGTRGCVWQSPLPLPLPKKGSCWAAAAGPRAQGWGSAVPGTAIADWNVNEASEWATQVGGPEVGTIFTQQQI